MILDEWLACADPAFLCEEVLHRASNRQLRLICCACCRRIADLLAEHQFEFIDVAERFADRNASTATLADTFGVAAPTPDLFNVPGLFRSQRALAERAVAFALAEPGTCFRSLFSASDAPAISRNGDLDDAIQRQERGAQCHLIRDVLGNPPRSHKVDLAWLTWRDGTVRNLAQVAYEERILPTGNLDPDRLAILADALEESGCTNEAILAHLRGPGLHVRGCWAVDLLLGKE